MIVNVNVYVVNITTLKDTGLAGVACKSLLTVANLGSSIIPTLALESGRVCLTGERDCAEDPPPTIPVSANTNSFGTSGDDRGEGQDFRCWGRGATPTSPRTGGGGGGTLDTL